MRHIRSGVFIIALAAALLIAGVSRAQELYPTVQGNTYVCYFYYLGSETQNIELAFSDGPSVSVEDGTGYGLYLTSGGVFAGYYLVLNQPVFRGSGAHALFDTRDVLTVLIGYATGYTIQGAGLAWTDFKNPQPFAFFGYQSTSEDEAEGL